LDKELAGRLNTLFGSEEKFAIFVEYIEQEEKLLQKTNLYASTDSDLRRNQGQLLALNKLKTLRTKIRDTL